MENGMDIANEENRLEGMKMAADDRALPAELVDEFVGGLDGPKDEPKDSEENEVFVEAMGPPQHERSDSQDFGEALEGENEAVDQGVEKFVQLIDVQEIDRGPDEHETIGVAVDVQVNDQRTEDQETVAPENCDGSGDAGADARSPKEQEASLPEKFGGSIDIQVNDLSPEEPGAADSDGKMKGSMESVRSLPLKQGEVGNEAMPVELNGVEANSVISERVRDKVEVSPIPVDNGEAILEDSKGEFVGESSNDAEIDGMNSDGPHVVVYEEPENGGSLQVILDKNGVSSKTDSKEQMMQDVSVRASIFPSEQTINQQIEEGPLKMDDGIVAETLPSVVKEDESTNSHVRNGIGEHPKEGREGRPSSDSKFRVIQDLGRGSVSVEGLGDSSSMKDGNKRTSSQQAPSATRCPENSGGPRLPSHPAGLGSSAPVLEPSARSLQQPGANGSVSQGKSQPSEEPVSDDTEENDETREKLQMIRVKFLRLAYRLGQTRHNVVVAQVLYRLGLAEQLRRNTNRPGVFSFSRASFMAEQLEAAGQEPLDFSCTMLVIGKTGVGKSATINSIFDGVQLQTDAFQPGTKKVQEITGMVQGIKVRIIDTPGLFSSSLDRRRNEKILHSVKKIISKTPPDIVLYFDRLDMQSRDSGDVPLLRTITDIFGPSIWFNAIVVLTHAASALPDGSNGSPLRYEMFVRHRCHVVQQEIRQAAGEVRLMNPVSLVENHSTCRMNRAGQRVLPNGQVWKPQLLLLSFSSKILAEANMLLKLQDNPPGKPFGYRARVVPPLPFLLSSLIQSRPQLKLLEQFVDNDTMDEDLVEASDSDDESDYDELPPFKHLTKSQLANLSRAQKKAYFEELDYREKRFRKKQLKDEKKRRKLMKKMAEAAKDQPNDYNNEKLEDESSGPASVPVPMPDLALPTSFDSDNPSHRYRFLDSSSQWLVRPVMETQGWDHDVGYDGVNVERLVVVKDKIPISVSGQLTKDKKECTLQMELASSIKHAEGKATSLGLDMQSVGKDIMAYTLRGETSCNNFRQNNTAAGLSVTVLGDSLSTGLKIEDKLVINKRFRLLMIGGAMTARGDVAYVGHLEATLRDKDYPIGRSLSTFSLSVIDWHGDQAIGCNVQSQLPLGRGTNMIGYANLSNKESGQIGIRLNSSEQLQIALLALVPIFRNVKRMLFGSSRSM